MDADFTPTELVRWDPSLLGAVLHLKYHRDVVKKRLRSIWKNMSLLYGHFPTDKKFLDEEQVQSRKCKTCGEDKQLSNVCVLVNEGIYVADDEFLVNHSPLTRYFKFIYNTKNSFSALSELKLNTLIHNIPHSAQELTKLNDGEVIHDGRDYDGYKKITIKLTKPDDNLLDKIHIAKVVKLPFQDKEVIIDLYPLSTLYKEWKADKDAKRPVRSCVKWHGIRPDWAGNETLTWQAPMTNVKRTYHSVPTIAEKKVDTHIPSCDCVMCLATKDHP
jgi:hypothetical protein